MGRKQNSWLNKYRRLSKDYDYLTQTSEATLLLAMIRTLVKRLSNKLREV